MATAHTLDMETPGMARICLHGDLQRFGKHFDLAIKTGAEGIHALCVQIPEFKRKLVDGWYQIRIAGKDLSPDDVAQRLHDPLPDGSIIHIVPRMEGAKSGVWQVLAGAVLVAASFIPGLNVVAAGVMFSMGTSMALGGISQMLAPKAPGPAKSADNGKQNTYFSTLDNMIAQGNPLPLLFGEMQIGSRVISQMLSTRDEGESGQVVVIGRPLRI